MNKVSSIGTVVQQPLVPVAVPLPPQVLPPPPMPAIVPSLLLVLHHLLHVALYFVGNIGVLQAI